MSEWRKSHQFGGEYVNKLLKFKVNKCDGNFTTVKFFQMFQESIRTYGDQHALGLTVFQCGNVQLSRAHQLLPTIFQVLRDCVTLYSSANEYNLKVIQCNIYIHFYGCPDRASGKRQDTYIYNDIS